MRIAHSQLRVATLVALSLPAFTLRAQDSTQRRAPQMLPPVVTVTRDVGRSTLELPYAITEITPDSAHPGQRHSSPDDLLFGVPGVTLANRTNPSQDPRISIRGFGARSAFGVRSIKVLRDGIPITLPDGQTPLDFVDLESVGRVEVIRGTASALYGNASGGIIDMRSAPPPSDLLTGQLRSWAGSWDTRRIVGVAGGTSGSASYQGNVGHTTTDNFRAYSRQRLTNGFARITLDHAGTSYALDYLGLDEPLAENPGALTESQWTGDPTLADPASVRKKARKAVRQGQLGLSAEHAMLGGELAASAYGGTRSLFNPLTFAVVGVDRKLWGGGARLSAALPGPFAQRLTIGADAQRQDDARKNWANCNAVATPTASCPTVGVEKGTLSLDQEEIVSSVGPYVRDELRLAPALDASVGVRADVVRFQVRDRYLADGDDSGERTLDAVSPMLGLVARLAPLHSAYASLSSAFETPTTTELGNQADGSAGLNRDLQPQYSTSAEMGVKGLALTRVQYDFAAYQTLVRDELIPYEVPGGNGRTYYRNAGRTRRRGIEASLSTELGPLALDASYTWSHFRFRDFAVDSAQYAGNAIPGVPEHQGQASATWHGRFAFATVEGIAKSAVWANDVNTARAPGYAIMNARVGGTALFGKPWLSPLFGVSNAFDRKYVGSLAVNASGATLATTKFYEPGAGRSWFVGLTVGAGH